MVAVSAASLGSLGIASAATSSTGQSTIVDKLATKFNLKKDEVQKVFDEDRAAHESEREKDMKTKLDQAVKDGKITQEQEDKLIAKLAELKADRPTKGPDSETDAERTAHKQKMDEFRQWLTDNKIPEDLVRPLGRHRGPGGPPQSN